MRVERGQIVNVEFENREFEAIVIDPNGLGTNQPSIGFGFTMMARHGGLPQSTSSQWVEGHPNTGDECLKLPSGNSYKVIRIFGLNNNEYFVLEVSDWVDVAVDVIKNPSKVRKPTKDKLVDFLRWFAVKGFYADAYATLKGSYTKADKRVLSAWVQARLGGITKRNEYTNFLHEQGCTKGFQYAKWTDYLYSGLFGMKKKKMIEVWDLVEGNKHIGRNYIPKVEGLKAVAYCEKQVIELFHSDLEQAHNDAIAYAKRRFTLK